MTAVSRHTGRTKRPQLRRLLATSAVLVSALAAAPMVGQAMADAGHFSVSDGQLLEGNAGTTLMNFTIRYFRPNTTTPATGWVTWTTSDLTATAANNDYVPVASRTETLTTTQTAGPVGGPGTFVEQAISVPIVGDTVFESNEVVRVTLTASGTPSAGYSTDIVDAEGLGTIGNDDAQAPPEDDHNSSPVIITAPALQPPPAPPQPPAPPTNNNNSTSAPITVTVPGPAQPQGSLQQGAPQSLVQQPTQTQSNSNAGRNDQRIEDDESGPTMGMQFHGLTDAARVRLRCPPTEEFCRGRIQLQLSGKTLGSSRLSIDGGAARWVSVRLTRSERRALRRAGGFYFKAITLDAAGNRQTTQRGFQV